MEINKSNYDFAVMTKKQDENRYLMNTVKQEKEIAKLLKDYAEQFEKGELRGYDNGESGLLANLSRMLMKYERTRTLLETTMDEKRILESLTVKEENKE